ncbi:MAG: 2-phospho-L-lactate guanylyltransferase [Actinomycetota bacterium]|nr:2-phospho-L-lactate guanylyltransferase [Actinomycetota bacterium]
MRTVAILPVKRFGAAKTRLGDAAGDVGRPALAEAMVADVLAATARVRGLDEVLVVTAEPRAEALARVHGARVVRDVREAGQSAAAKLGLQRVRAADRAVLLPGDCPALDPSELDALLDEAPAPRSVVVVPDRWGTGTNGLVLTPPGALVPAFGIGSRARHERAAAAAGLTCVVAEVPSLALDVDSPEDLAALRTALDARGGAARTRELLALAVA